MDLLPDGLPLSRADRAPAAPGGVAARPLFDRFRFERRLSYHGAGVALGVSRETVRLLCLEFDNPRRLKPGAALALRIEAFTEGAVPAWSFDDTPAARAAFFTPPAAAGAAAA